MTLSDHGMKSDVKNFIRATAAIIGLAQFRGGLIRISGLFCGFVSLRSPPQNCAKP
jgi:hypothetical protein